MNTEQISNRALLILAATAVTALLVIAAAPAAHAQDGQANGAGHAKAQFLASYDTNGDAVVSRAEYDAQRGEQFARANADSAGDVSEDEYVGEYAARLEQELAAQRERQLAQAHVRFGVLDTDDDGRISRAEFDASGLRIFTRLDTNSDGVVDERDTAENY